MLELSDKKIKNIKINYPKRVGACIKYFREKEKITQTKLAELTNKDRQYIYKIEKGKVTPNIVTIKIILSALEISASEFFKKVDEK